MSNTPIRVLAVDDSALQRQIIADLIAGAARLELVGTARNGQEAVAKTTKLRPDVVTLDVEMPHMDGLETLSAILRARPTPVIMVSALTRRAADVTLRALELGALDYIPKPQGFDEIDSTFRHELTDKIRGIAGTDVNRVLRIRESRAQRSQSRRRALPAAGSATTRWPGTMPSEYSNCCIAIGISTGGPSALCGLFALLKPPLPAIVVVQHMPANFTHAFARRLNSVSQLTVKEAQTGDALKSNVALVAPGGRHLRLRAREAAVYARTCFGELVNGHRPSVDLLMQDAAKAFGKRCLGVIMTGMGCDGAAGCGAIRDAGGYVLGQDEASSDVYGMNKVAMNLGHVDRQFSLEELPRLIARQCREMSRC